ncbi:MAG: hypothetical protein WCJ59_01910 [bacterium]
MRKRGLFLSAGMLVLVAILHFFAIRYFIYWRFWWSDTIIHFLSGLSVAAASYWLIVGLSERFQTVLWNKKRSLLSILIIVIISVLWEYFEMYYGISSVSHRGYWLDSAKDMCSAVLGGFVALLLFNNWKKNEQK